MIDPEKLRAVTTIVCHRNPEVPCPDGVASALILRDVLPGLEIRFMTHDAALLGMDPEPNVLFCDIAPPRERAEEWRRAGAVVLDHHRTARAVVESFGDAGVFACEKEQPGVSGATLAFREVWMPLAYRGGQRPGSHEYEGRQRDAFEELARLAGVRDTWQKKSPDFRRASAQAEALMWWPWSAWKCDGFGEETRRMLSLGETLLEKREARTRELISLGARVTTRKGTKVLIIPSRETSDVAEALGDQVDLLVGFGFGISADHLPTLQVSTRSHAGFDCGAFCKANGGGGHTAAAGCTLELDYADSIPHAVIVDLLNQWEAEERRIILPSEAGSGRRLR